MTTKEIKERIEFYTSEILTHETGVYKIKRLEDANELIFESFKKTFKLENIATFHILPVLQDIDKYGTLSIRYLVNIDFKDLIQSIDMIVYDCRLSGDYIKF